MEAKTMIMCSNAFSNLSDVVTAITTQESITALDNSAYSASTEITESNPYNLVTANGEHSVETVMLNVADVFGDEANVLINSNKRQLHFLLTPDGSLKPIFNDETLEAAGQQADECVTFDTTQTIPASDYESQNAPVIQVDSNTEFAVKPELGNEATLYDGTNNDTSENLGQELMLSEESGQSENQDASLEAANQDEDNSNTVVIDVSNPIQLCQNSLIVVDGKRCILQHDLESGQLLAYPIKEAENPPKRRRGRPRRHNSQVGIAKSPKKVQNSSTADQPFELQDPAPPNENAENNNEEFAIEADTGFIEQANEDGEIVKRSARKRKKTSLLAEYETNTLKFQCSSDEEYSRDQDDGDDLVPGKRSRLTKKGAKTAAKKAPTTITTTQLSEKRGRGRPRRYGLKPPEPPPTQAFLVHTANGQAVMIKVPLSSLSPGKSLQHSAQDIADCLNSRLVQKSILPLAPKPINDDTSNNDAEVPISSLDETQAIKELPAVKEEQPYDESVIESQNEPVFEDEIQEKSISDEQVDSNDQAVTDNEQLIPSITNGNEENVIYPISVIMTDNAQPVKIGLKATENDLEKLKCHKCEYQAYYHNQYQEHIAIHQDDVLQCKCCEYLSFTQEDLLEHYNAHHPKCICQICNHTVAQPYVMKRHMYKHAEMSAKCTMCGKTYRDQYTLRMHVKNVHTPAEEFFACHLCSKTFTRKAHLKRHIRTHDPIKPYKCDQCEYRGGERSDITKHKLIHEEPKFACEDCNRTFRHVKNLELHMKRHKGQRDFKCGACAFSGYTVTDIRKHIGRKHTDSKTSICGKCGQAFNTEQELQEHRDSDQCELFMLEQALQERENLEDSPQPEDDLIDEEGSLLNATVSQDSEGITSITLMDDSSATLRAIQGITGHIVVSSDLGEIAASQLLDASLSDNQELTANELTLEGEQFTILTDADGNKHFTMVTENGQLLSGAFTEGDTIPTYIENEACVTSETYEVDSNTVAST